MTIGERSEKSPDFRACALAAARSLSLLEDDFMVEKNPDPSPLSLSRRFWNNVEISWWL
jgi:hypothetical protein